MQLDNLFKLYFNLVSEMKELAMNMTSLQKEQVTCQKSHQSLTGRRVMLECRVFEEKYNTRSEL
jgi:hypothetical protein